ncbi:pyrimidine reductase family protein [Amycolatopsis panacis]|uniref:Pyrimidine reductase family protein n=1 Tax=Amycolatopsis panacis TaxID=2340917 RepID=A0A419I4I4_9PSEU|nr:pyrimidine reductase family protein [Amycolatopsis panacis]
MVAVRIVWPPSPEERGDGTALSDADLERIYGYPPACPGPFVQVNFVASADGAVAVNDLSAGLSNPADKRVFLLARDLADVILVGAGTAGAEGYRGARTNPVRAARRERLGRCPVPPVAVVTRSGALDPAAPLFTDTHVPPIVLTTARADTAALTRAGAEVLVCGEDDVDLERALALLSERGLRRVDCEGGPRLFASLAAAGLVDQLCLTVAPILAGGGAGRIAAGPAVIPPQGLELASVLVEDSAVLLRYRRCAG